VAAAVLGDLWRRRQERSPVLIVIDEAHNVCPAEPDDRLVAVAAGHATRIAAEGRKFGLYLLISTQRPQKIPENVLSQADNLVLLRLNSLADSAFAQAAFSFVPPSLIDRSVTFRQGEGLIAGKITASTQNQLEKSFASATAVARQYPQYANAITAGAKTSFLHGADWAYAAGVITTVVGIALVFFLFPRKDNEQRLLGEYHQADSTQVKASPAARVRGQSSPGG